MFARTSVIIHGGTFMSQIDRTRRGMDILLEWVATGAFHDSDELYDAPKCHPHTRIAVLDDIMKWASESESAWDEYVLWVFGPAGAGKSAIAKRIAEIASERDLLTGDFFFSRSSPTRNTKDRLVATLAYQLALSIPDTRSYIEDAIERDPAIFNKNILIQTDTLIIRPLQSVSSTQTVPYPKLIIIDGLDECNDRQAQVAILEAISCSFPHKLPIRFLVVSRPEPDLVTSFGCNEPLKFIHRRLALDSTYRPDDDIRVFFSDEFEHIKRTHPLRLTIPITWPTQETLEKLVARSAGQFIYASTVVKFVGSDCHQPSACLNTIVDILPPGRMSPFAELDGLYNHILSSVDDLELTLRVLGLYAMTADFAHKLHNHVWPESFLSLELGDIRLALKNLSSIVTYHESSGVVKVLHTSLVEFLSDRRRSATFYIDKASMCTGFVRRILQYVKGPDGIQAGDIRFLHRATELFPWIPKGQLRSDILNFDLDAFINASIRWQYKKRILLTSGPAITAFRMWMEFLGHAGLDDGDKKEAIDRLNKSLESRLQIYQSDSRLQLLLTFTVANVRYVGHHGVPSCRCVDILLEMNDNDLHLVDQHALDLRHAYLEPWTKLIDITTSYMYGATNASAALHCMRFLSNPPKYSEKNELERHETGLIYVEWKATCAMSLEILRKLLEQADTSPELVQFISNHDIHPAVQKHLPAKQVWEVDVHILAFLGRACVCPNWRIISAIQRSPIVTHQQPSGYVKSHQDKERKATQHLIRQRLIHRCSNIHYRYI